MALDASPPAAHAGTKRSNPPEHEPSHKKRKIQHTLRHVQPRPAHIEPAPQDPVFAQGQLLKSIGAALVTAGYDSVKPSALEMFRAQTEEYILRFLKHARISMQDGRRTKPTALDFASALAQMPNAHTASLLSPQLGLPVPEDVSCPSIPQPGPAPAPAPDFSRLLEPLMAQEARPYIPKHFPSLPSSHAWEQTPVFPEREKDARKMREKATEEGKLAEKALRKLAAAAKTSATNAERRRSSVLSGQGKPREPHSSRAGVQHEDTFADVLRDLGAGDDGTELNTAGTARDGMESDMLGGVVVNHDMSHWRKAGRKKGLRG